jgi:hypothetical protein
VSEERKEIEKEQSGRGKRKIESEGAGERNLGRNFFFSSARLSTFNGGKKEMKRRSFVPSFGSWTKRRMATLFLPFNRRSLYYFMREGKKRALQRAPRVWRHNWLLLYEKAQWPVGRKLLCA